MAYEELQDDIVAELADDYLSLGQVTYLAREYVGTSNRDTAEAAFSAVSDLMRRGKVVAGFVGDHFEPWPDQKSKAIERIEHELRDIIAEDRLVGDDEICWLDLADRAVVR